MANVKNRLDQAIDGDNALRVGGTMDIESTATFKIGGETVNTSGLAEKLNNLDSVEEVANKTGGDLTAGTLVYISGYDATLDLPTVAEADADDATKKATLVLTDAIANNASGSAEPTATITGLDTSAASAVGSFAYESTTAGEFTFTAPTDANDDRRVVGVVKVKDASVGSIYFFPGKGGLEHAAVYLNNLTPGTVSANGAVVVDANLHQDVVHTASLNLGATGATVAVTATGTEINRLDDSAEIETIDSGVAVSTVKFNTKIDNTTTGAGAITLDVCPATMVGKIKTIRMEVDGGDVTLALTNVVGGTAATTATFDAVDEELILIGSSSGKWVVIKELGVTLVSD